MRAYLQASLRTPKPVVKMLVKVFIDGQPCYAKSAAEGLAKGVRTDVRKRC